MFGTKPGFLSVVFCKTQQQLEEAEVPFAKKEGGKEGKLAKLGILGSMTFL